MDGSWERVVRAAIEPRQRQGQGQRQVPDRKRQWQEGQRQGPRAWARSLAPCSASPGTDDVNPECLDMNAKVLGYVVLYQVSHSSNGLGHWANVLSTLNEATDKTTEGRDRGSSRCRFRLLVSVLCAIACGRTGKNGRVCPKRKGPVPLRPVTCLFLPS